MNVQLHITHTINNIHPWIHDRISLINCSLHLYIIVKVCQHKIIFNIYCLMFIGNFKNNFKFKYIFYCRETIKGFQQRLKCIVDI